MNRKRPLECLAGGFVLGEVLALLPVGWMAGILAALTAGVCYLRKKCGRSLMWWLLPFFVLWGMLWHKGDLRRGSEYERTAGILAGRDIRAEGTVKGIQGRKDGSGLVLELSDVKVFIGEKRERYGNILAYIEQQEGDEGLRIGERVCVGGRLERFDRPGNPGEFDMERYYHAIGIEGRFFARSMARLQEGYSPYLDGIYRLRCHAGAVLDRICTQEDKGIFRAVILGEKTEISADIKRLYQSSGISHLLAISGLHISMIGLGCYGLLRKAGLGFSGAGAVGTAVTVSYGILAGGTGLSASICRAVFMVLMRMWADHLGRTYDMRTAAAFSGLLLLVKSPGLLFQAGFQLSFGSVMTLAVVQPVMERWLGAEKGWQKTLLAGAAIQLVTCPVAAYHYFEYPVCGILLNLVVIPLMSYVLLSGILGIFLGSAGAGAGMAVVGTGHYILRFYRWICERAGTFPWAVLVTGRPGWVQMGAYGVMWCIALSWMTVRSVRDETEERERSSRAKIWKRRGFLALFAGASLAILLFRAPLEGMETVFLDVGQGDGICIRTKDTVILVDGGSTDRKMLGERVLEPFLKSRGISRVDYAIVSHGDLDHISGLMELMEEGRKIKISHVILPQMGREGDEIYKKIEQAARQHGAVTHWMGRGDRIREGRLEIDCLYAGEEENAAGGKDRNEHSLMLLVRYDLAGILLTGDMSARGEERWLEMGETLQVQVLKVAHHGSSYSTKERFLERIKPEWAVISCGEGNRYGHPGADTIERLEEQGVRWHVTADAGAVTVRTDGRRMTVYAVYPH